MSASKHPASQTFEEFCLHQGAFRDWYQIEYPWSLVAFEKDIPRQKRLWTHVVPTSYREFSLDGSPPKRPAQHATRTESRPELDLEPELRLEPARA